MINPLKNLRIKRHAIAILAGMHFYGNPSKKLKIVGVTGTSGKTTTATLLYEIALALDYKVGLISTVSVLISGKEFEIERKNPTTPDVLTLNKILQKMVEENCEYVFMEVTSHALDQGRVAGIKFVGGIFTNLTQDHFDYHKNFENYFQAKHKFFKMLDKDAFALSNIDDDYGIRMLEETKAIKLTYGFKGGENFHGEIKKLDFNGSELIFNNKEIHTKLLGRFNAYNLLAVWGASKLLGFDMDKVNKIIENIEAPRGRFEQFKTSSGVLVIVDYAHKPDAVEKVLKAVKETILTKGKIISLFGCGGNKDTLKRSIMGKMSATLADISIFTSDNPRDEEPEAIIEDMKKTLSEEELKKVICITNRHDAIKEAIKIAQSGDIIIAMGKGHETYQEIKGVRNHFDDMEEFKKAYQ